MEAHQFVDARETRLSTIVQLATLTIRVPLGLREVFSKFFCGVAWAVAGSIALDAPAFFQRAGVHGVESELVE